MGVTSARSSETASTQGDVVVACVVVVPAVKFFVFDLDVAVRENMRSIVATPRKSLLHVIRSSAVGVQHGYHSS